MNIDEFLDCDKIIEKVGQITILKIKYNDNIDFLYKPSYGEFEYGNELHFLGFFEKITKKLYGESWELKSEYDAERNSNYYESPIDKIGENLKKGVDMYLNKYIEENKTLLMNIGKRTFDKYISTDANYTDIKNSTINDYIYNRQNSETSFSISSNFLYKRNIKELILKYVQNPIETVRNLFTEYINNKEDVVCLYIDDSYKYVSVNEYLGVILLKQQFENSLLQELKENPNNEYKKKHDIIQSIKDLDAQMVTITLNHNNEMIEFKYPKGILETLDFYKSRISDLKIRDKLEELFKDFSGRKKDEIFIKEIAKIEYKKKVIYEDKELLKFKENVSKSTLETHDIVDDMFE